MSTDAKKTNAQEEKDLVMVSFKIEKSLKERVTEAAQQHERTMTKQFIQSLEDGLSLQGVIEEVNAHLTETIEVDGKTFVYKPNEQACLDFIVSATQLVIDQQNREKETK